MPGTSVSSTSISSLFCRIIMIVLNTKQTNLYSPFPFFSLLISVRLYSNKQNYSKYFLIEIHFIQEFNKIIGKARENQVAIAEAIDLGRRKPGSATESAVVLHIHRGVD